MVRHFDGSSEDSHDPVTYIGDERAAVGEDRVSHRLEVPVEEVDHLLGRELLRAGREPTKVTEHDGRDQFFAAEPQVGVRLCEHLVDHRFGYEAGEDVPDSLALERGKDVMKTERRRRGERQGRERIDEGEDEAVAKRELSRYC